MWVLNARAPALVDEELLSQSLEITGRIFEGQVGAAVVIAPDPADIELHADGAESFQPSLHNRPAINIFIANQGRVCLNQGVLDGVNLGAYRVEGHPKRLRNKQGQLATVTGWLHAWIVPRSRHRPGAGRVVAVLKDDAGTRQ